MSAHFLVLIGTRLKGHCAVPFVSTFLINNENVNVIYVRIEWRGHIGLNRASSEKKKKKKGNRGSYL